jgi:hypothetical protein
MMQELRITGRQLPASRYWSAVCAVVGMGIEGVEPGSNRIGGESMSIGLIEVQRHLRGVDYPVTAVELARIAERNAAPAEIVDELRRHGDEQFEDSTDVMHALIGELLEADEWPGDAVF